MRIRSSKFLALFDFVKGKKSLGVITHFFLKEKHVRFDFREKITEGFNLGKPSITMNVEGD